MTGALCLSWISLASMADALSALRFSASSAMLMRNTRIWPLFVPAQRVADIVCAAITIILINLKAAHNSGPIFLKSGNPYYL